MRRGSEIEREGERQKERGRTTETERWIDIGI